VERFTGLENIDRGRKKQNQNFMSNIEWTGKTLNPTIGCTEVSAGCRECYAAKMAWRLTHMHPDSQYNGLTKKLANGRIVWTGKIKLLPERLAELAKNKKPTVYFVDSMSDLFHEEIPFDFILKAIFAMEDTPWHTFQILTKRPKRAVEFFEWHSWKPSKNIWIGVSVEDQKAANERIPLLLQIPAAIRFLSCEPLLGPLDLRKAFYQDLGPARIHWVITGGESGSNARVCSSEWMADIVKQCKAAGVPVFVKQMGKKLAQLWRMSDSKGGKLEEFPEGLRYREFPKV
jgi:protein gp37